jgi:hypothetical protein
LALTAVALLLAVAWATPAMATLYRNPIQDVRSGQMQAGFGLSRDLLSLFFDLGLGESGTLDLEVGNIDLPGGNSGTQVGVGYRHEIGRKPSVGSKTVRLAPFGLLNIGTGDADYTQLDLGFGGSLPIEQQFAAFGGAVFRYFDTPVGSDTRLGVILGGEFKPVENWLVGLELHLGFEKDTFGLYTALRF